MGLFRTRLTALAASAAALLAFAATADARIRTQSFEYKHGDVVLEGFIAYDDANKGKRPGVVIFPSWIGPSDHERDAAKRLAAMGYVAMVADPYGKGIRPTPPKETRAEMDKYMGNRPLFRDRVNAALDVLKKNANVDVKKLAAIGYCFGGGAVLELGRSGADVAAIVSFHGSLSNPTPADAAKIKGRVLVLHGADDPAVPQKEVDAFQKEMREAKLDWQFVSYSGTVHSFTMPRAGNDNSRGSAYNERSDKRSWVAMQAFFKETLGK